DDLPSPPDSSRPALRRLERDFQRARDPGHRPGRLSSRIRRGGLSDRAQRARRAGARQCGDLPAAVERRAGFFQKRIFRFRRRGFEAGAGETDPDLVRRRHAGGLPARTTLPTFAKLVAYSRALCEKAGKPRLTAAVMPFTSVGTNRNDALKDIDVPSLIAEANKYPTWVKPPSGVFSALEDIRGFILAGSPAEIARAARD